ncbi:hypothetical protein BDN70DRAFT_887472 [Pholiota conissans]|uniref:F-box domain-containing protein n=1 Tax=Pholiota conissans TaxID=109636 RepID=A0A9P5YN60_9AGAR|nr:hypothetical protein BDN70DRAFT_887472 [Pholiota conissans]
MSTRSAKTAAASKLQKIAAASGDEESEVYETDDLGSALSEEESDYGFEDRKGEPPAKRAKTSTGSTPRKQAATPAKAPLKRGKKSLSLLPTMPLDVLFEILGQLSPKDLLSVSRTNKLFRETLLSSGARTVWKCALKGQGVPECPSDLIEPRWTSLLFGTRCESCGAKNIQKVDFHLRRRVCVKCRKANLLVTSKARKVFPDCDEIVLDLIPSTNVGGWAHGHRSSSQFYWHSDIDEMTHTLATYIHDKYLGIPGAQNALSEFIKQRTAQVDEIHSSAIKFQEWFDRTASERYNETNYAKHERFKAIKTRFLDLGYHADDIQYIKWEKECNQKAALSDAIWKRIRPILEPTIIERRDERIERQTLQIRNRRRQLLFSCYTDYKASLSPLQWKYMPDMMELEEKDPFKTVMKSAYDLELTEADFAATLFPAAIAQIQDEWKAKLVQVLVEASEPGLVIASNCLDLATSVFCCMGTCQSEIYVVGTDDILSHNCGTYTSTSSFYSYEYKSRDFEIHPTGAKIARSLMICAGLDPEKMLASEMDNKDLRFACNPCQNNKVGYTWRNALAHRTRNHSGFGILPSNWRILSPDETAVLKQNEAKDPKWAMQKWQCSHCPAYMTSSNGWSGYSGVSRETAAQHVQTEHAITSPAVPTDIFYFEKTATPFRLPEKLKYAIPPPPQPPRPKGSALPARASDVVDKICLSCSSGSQAARNRLFMLSGVIAHLRAKHSVNDPQQGVHWAVKT